MKIKGKNTKKILALLICMGLVILSVFPSFAEERLKTGESQTDENVLGDVSTDGQITAEDAALVLEWVLGRVELSDEQINLARVTGTKNVEVKDAAAILAKVLDNSFVFIPYTGDDEDTTERKTESLTETTTKKADEGEETTETTTKKTDEGEETTETTTKKADEGEETTETTTKKADEGEETTETTTKKADEGEETTETTTINVNETESVTESTTESEPRLILEIKGDDFKENTTFTADYVTGDFTIKATADKSVMISDNKVSYGGESFSKRIDLRGTGSESYRSISFKVNQNVLIKVIGKGGTPARGLALSDGGGVPLSTQEFGSTADLGEYTYETDSEKTLYLYSRNSGISIYKIEVWATGGSGGSEETTTETTTENVTENTTESVTETKAPDYSLDLGDANAGEISENTTVGNINVLANPQNKVIVTDVNEVYNGTEYKKALSLTSNGSVNAGALNIKVPGTCIIKIAAKGGGTLVIEDNGGGLMEQPILADGISYYAFNYNNGEGDVYIYAKDLSQNILIYSVDVFSSYSKFSLSGFGAGKITGGGSVSESSPSYAKVSNAKELDTVLYAIQSGKSNVKVIEITSDLNLGINEVKKAHPDHTFKLIQSQGVQALNNDILKETGISKINFDNIQNLTIYSKNGAKIKHGCFNFSSVKNIIIRNLEFDEIWEWDEGSIDDNKELILGSDGKPEAEPGAYDRNDWDYMTFKKKDGQTEGSSNVWVDHCTFNKAYDGILDVKNASNNIVVSWCKIQGDDMSEGSWVRRQIEQLEEAYQNDLTAGTKTYPLYYHLRKDKGYTPEEIIKVEAPQKKAHLIGAGNSEANMDKLSITIANCYYKEIQDRIPRLRGGNAHVFNTVIDSSGIYKTKSEKSYSASLEYFHFGVTNQALLSTCDGALKAENLYMLDVSDPMRFEQDRGYAGKLIANNIKYQLHDKKDFTKWQYDYKSAGSEDGLPGFKPYGKYTENIGPFSWNESGSPEYIKNGELNYDYSLISPENLLDEVVPFTGAGVMKNWNEEWLVTSYE
ncbi:MAG: hypothetical protein HFE59_05805 [Clostridiales bacterium]|nr:hypothetical protein [Clostridiales bacterium]